MIAAIIERLNSIVGPEGDGTFRVVDGAIALSLLKTAPPQIPAAYVIPLQERPQGRNSVDQRVRQAVDCEFGVVIWATAGADPTGKKLTDVLQPLRDAVDRALLGFQPTDDSRMTDYAGGDLLGFTGNAVQWQDSYCTTYIKKSEA